MKLVRLFMSFVMISLFVGLGSAFNGTTIEENLEDEVITEVAEKTESVDNEEVINIEEDVPKEDTQEKNNQNSFSDSKSNTSITNTNSNTKNTSTTPKQETTTKQEQTTTTSTNNNSNSNSNTTNQDNSSSNATKSNETSVLYDSITHGKTEYESDSACYNAGISIQDKELDAILDWNELHEDEPKQPLINYSKCYPVIKDGKTYWYLHFFTTLGEGMDDELKSLYK